MKRLTSTSAFILLALPLSAKAQTICGYSAPVGITCTVGRCSQYAVIYPGDNTGSGQVYYGQVTSCCGQYYQSYAPYGYSCGTAEFKDPRIHERLGAFSAVHPILVATCEGHYTQFRGSLSSRATLAARSSERETVHLKGDGIDLH